MPSIRLLLLALCLAPSAHAQQVYKWVDAEGRTHYSATKPEAAGAKASEVTIKLPPQDLRAAQRDVPVWPSKPSGSQTTAQPTATPAPKQGWEYSDKPETNESRCALARAIMDGSAKRVGGAKVDQNDRNIAQNDIKAFCR